VGEGLRSGGVAGGDEAAEGAAEGIPGGGRLPVGPGQRPPR